MKTQIIEHDYQSEDSFDVTVANDAKMIHFIFYIVTLPSIQANMGVFYVKYAGYKVVKNVKMISSKTVKQDNDHVPLCNSDDAWKWLASNGYFEKQGYKINDVDDVLRLSRETLHYKMILPLYAKIAQNDTANEDDGIIRVDSGGNVKLHIEFEKLDHLLFCMANEKAYYTRNNEQITCENFTPRVTFCIFYTC
jgi:hypothetical protein